jgi:hypothetical protein
MLSASLQVRLQQSGLVISGFLHVRKIAKEWLLMLQSLQFPQV